MVATQEIEPLGDEVTTYASRWVRSFPQWDWNELSIEYLWWTTKEAAAKGIWLKQESSPKPLT